MFEGNWKILNFVNMKRASEIIAFNFGMDMKDVSESRYQPTVYNSPAIYTLGGDYYCAPTARQTLPRKGFKWERVGQQYGRFIYKHTASK